MRQCLLAAMGCACAGTAYAEPVSFADALARAASSAPSIQAAGLQIQASRSAAHAAGQLPDPKLSVGIADFPISGPLAGRPELDNFSEVTLGYAQDIPSRAKRRARIAEAQAVVSEGEAQLLAEQRSARVSAGLAWIDLYYAELKLSAFERLRTEVNLDASTAPARLASGASRPGAALEPAQALAGLEDRADALRAARLKARAELGRWIGPDPKMEAADPPPSLAVDPIGLRADLDQSPQLMVKTAAVRQAEAERGAARAETHSDWGYELEYARRDPRFGDYVSAKLNFSLPLFTAKRQDPLIEARTLDVGRALADREATRRELEATLEDGLAEHAMHIAQLRRARDVLIPLARRRAELESASYQAGAATLSDVLVARRAKIEAELAALDLEADVVRDGVRLDLTYGEEPR